MRRALIVEFGLCGIGHDPGPPRALRLWVLHVSLGRGVLERLAHQQRMRQRLLRLLLLITQRAAQARATFPLSVPMVAIDETLAADILAAVGDASRVEEDSS